MGPYTPPMAYPIFSAARSARYALLLSVCLAGPTLADGKAVGTVSGKVVDAAGRANESVKVTVSDGGKELATGYSDSDGKFTLENVPVGKGYTVLAVRAVKGLTMSGQKDDVAVKRGKATDVGKIQIDIGSPGGGQQ